MRTLLILLLLANVAICPCFAQSDGLGKKVRNGVWYTPSGKAEEINGLAVGLQSDSWQEHPLTINGLNVELSLFGFLAFPYAFFLSFQQKALEGAMFCANEIYPEHPDSTYIQPVTIRGFSVSVGGLMASQLNGVAINGLSSTVNGVSGLALSGFMNLNYEVNGVAVAGFRNKTYRGKGLYIALFNRCHDCRGIQIGLPNRNGKRVLPFLNWDFSSRTE